MLFGIDCSECCSQMNCIQVDWAKVVDIPARGCSNINEDVVLFVYPPLSDVDSDGPYTIYLDGGYDDKGTVTPTGGLSDWGPGGPGGCTGGRMPTEVQLPRGDRGGSLRFGIVDTVGGNIGMGACICLLGTAGSDFSDVPLNPGGGSTTVAGWRIVYPSNNNPFGPNRVTKCGPLRGSNPLP